MSVDAESPNVAEPGRGDERSRRGFLTGAAALGAAAGLGAAMSAAESKPPQAGAAVNPRMFSFVGGKAGEWSVVSAKAAAGDPLPTVERLHIVAGSVSPISDDAKWILRGVTSNERYVTRGEKDQLVGKQAAIGRSAADHAALIPIRKNAKWWALTQDERRAVFEERSRHVTIGLKYLPAVARRLHHCRDLSENEPFDFLTLFDYAKADAAAFDDILAELRATEEWKFVEREVDIRLVRGEN